jgi:hypothetical protein
MECLLERLITLGRSALPIAFAVMATLLLTSTLPAAATPSTGAPCTTGDTIYVLTTPNNRLLTFDSNRPELVTAERRVTGLQPAERLLGIDIRPATGQLYAVGTSNRLYTIDPSNGAATPVGSGPFAPALEGDAFGFDFNPTVDRIRIVSNTGQNLRLHPDTGAVAAVDGDLAYATTDANAGRAPLAVGAGYTNSVAGATTTQLYVIDAEQNVLTLQNPPNNGTLNTVGPLGISASRLVGFDVSPDGNAYTALAVRNARSISVGPIDLELNGNDALFARINLSTGQVTPIGEIAYREQVVGLAVQPK